MISVIHTGISILIILTPRQQRNMAQLCKKARSDHSWKTLCNKLTTKYSITVTFNVLGLDRIIHAKPSETTC